MMKVILLLVTLLSVSACIDNYELDNEKRVEIFKECMASLPEGPRETKYNDWAEVVSECKSFAFYAARVCTNCNQ